MDKKTDKTTNKKPDEKTKKPSRDNRDFKKTEEGKEQSPNPRFPQNKPVEPSNPSHDLQG